MLISPWIRACVHRNLAETPGAPLVLLPEDHLVLGVPLVANVQLVRFPLVHEIPCTAEWESPNLATHLTE